MARITGSLIALTACFPLADPAALLGQGKIVDPPNSLPIWTKPSDAAKKELGKIARANEAGVYLLGDPKNGFGTGWMISKKHRLIVTNAHVADIRHRAGGKMFAIPSGTAQLYTVEKVWYHPGVRRHLEGNRNLSVRSGDPEAGQVDPLSPDLAILQLSKDGPDPTVEFAPATPAEIAGLFAESAAILGFPGTDTSWPQLGDKAAATFHDGVISRVTDFNLAPAAPADSLMLQYTMATWGGFSGSPLLLPSGRVAGVHNMARPVVNKGSGESKWIPHGLRIDCVLDMLVHHKLEDQVPFKIDRKTIDLDRWIKPDLRGDKAREALAEANDLVAEARFLIIAEQKFQSGLDKCEQALKRAPNHAQAHMVAGLGLLGYYGHNYEKLDKRARLKFLESALASVADSIKIVPADPEGYARLGDIKANIGFVKGDEVIVGDASEMLTKFLTTENMPDFVRATAHGARAGCHKYLGEKKAALKDYTEAVRLNPNAPGFWENRAVFWDDNARPDLAKADRAKAEEVREKIATINGLTITELTDGGAAQAAGLKVGDAILAVGDTNVYSFEELAAALAKVTGSVELSIIRGKTERIAKVTVSPASGKIGVSVKPRKPG